MTLVGRTVRRVCTRRSFGAGAAVGASGVLGFVAGCAPLPGDGKPSTKETVTLRLPWNATEAEHTFAVRGPVFEQKNPNIKLQFEPSSEYLTKLAIMFSTDTVGDVVFLEADDDAFYGYWGAQGKLTQIDPYIKRDKYDMNVFFPKAVEALKITDGKIWSFPYKAFVARCGLFYNATMFQRAGVPLPTDDWTYNDIVSAAQRLTVRSGSDVSVWGGGRNFGGDFSFMAVTRAFGGDLYSPDGKKTLINSEQSRQAITWWLDRYLKDRTVALNPGVSNPRALFEQGTSAFTMGYNPGDRIRIANALNPTGQQWGLSLMPKGPSGRRGGAFFLTPTGMAKITKHPDESWELMKFLAEKETGLEMGFPTATSGQASAHFGARKDIYTDPRFLNAPNMPPGVMAALGRSMAIEENYSFAHNYLSNDVEKVLNETMAKAVKAEVSYDAGFFNNLAQQIQVILDKPAPVAPK
jgi:multiple sugar transport system substrate-binding protein